MLTRTTLALLVAAAPAIAQEPPTAAQVGAQAIMSGTFEAPGDQDRYTYRLKAGEDYAVSLFPDAGTISGVFAGPDSLVLEAGVGTIEEDFGFEVRARATGKHTLIVEPLASFEGYPTGYRVRVSPDCRGASTTKCVLRIGKPQQRQHAWAFDDDWRRLLGLRKGKRYAIRFTGGLSTVRVVTRAGKAVASAESPSPGATVTLPFTASTTELYVAMRGEDDVGGKYRVELQRR